MTFAEELRHAISVEPVLDAPDWPGDDAPIEAKLAWREARIPKPRDPGTTRVLEIEEGFRELLAVCRSKDLFTRPMWLEMGFEGDDEAQLRAFLAVKCPVPGDAALWIIETHKGTFCRLLIRTHPAIAYSALSVGSGMTEDNRRETYRALWDVGIRELRNHARPDNPHTKTMLDMGHFTFAPDASGRYLEGKRVFTERP